MHGLLGAALLWIVAWFLAVYLVREMMTSHVEEQRRMYNERVEAMRAALQGGPGQSQPSLAAERPAGPARPARQLIRARAFSDTNFLSW